MNRQRIDPGPDQESVCDYPRPPRVEETGWHVKVVFSGRITSDIVGPFKGRPRTRGW